MVWTDTTPALLFPHGAPMSEFHVQLPTSWTEAAGGNPFRLTGQLAEQIKQKLLSAIELPPREKVLAEAAAAYEKYVAPLDIPFVPNLVEPLVDARLQALFVESVGRMYDAIAAKQTPTLNQAP